MEGPDVDEPGTLAVLIPGDAGEVLTLQRAALPPQVRTIGLAAGQYSHANVRLYRRHGYRQTHTTQASAYLLIHLAKARTRWPGAASSRPGRS